MRLDRSLCLVAVLVVSITSPIGAQDPNHVLTHGSGNGPGDFPITYDNTSADNVAGFSWGACIADPAVIDATALTEGQAGTDLGGFAFFAPAILPGQGHTVGIVVDFFGMIQLEPGTGYEIAVASYACLQVAMDSDVDFCDTLGMPTVMTNVVLSDGAAVVPTAISGSVFCTDDPEFEFRAPDTTAGYDPAQDTTVVDVTVTIEDVFTVPQLTAGFSMGLADSSAEVGIDVTGLDPSPLEAAIGGSPAFFGPALLVGGWTVGVVYDFFGMITLEFNGPTDVITATYEISGLLGDLDGATAFLDWSDAIGMPPVANTVVVGADAQSVGFVDGVIVLGFVDPHGFIRGDCNEDGLVNIADGIFILNALFQGGPSGGCEAACDANDDGGFDQSDAVYIFNYRFLGGSAPPAPFPDCGVGADVPCDAYGGC